MSADWTGVNFQPETDNPHDGGFDDDSDDEGLRELSREVLVEGKAVVTSDFDSEEPDDVMGCICAAYVSSRLEDSFEEDGVYLMAEVGPLGVFPIAVADEDRFFIDNDYDPDEVTDEASPMDIIERTPYSNKLMKGMMAYEVTDLKSVLNLDSVDEAWGETYDFEERSQPYIVAPGLEEPYRENIQEML